LTAELFHPTITLEVLLAARAVGALSYLQGKMFTEGKLRCRWKRRQRKRRNTKRGSTSHGPWRVLGLRLCGDLFIRACRSAS